MTLAAVPGPTTFAWSLHLAGFTDKALSVLDGLGVDDASSEAATEALEVRALILRRDGALDQSAAAYEALARVNPEHPHAAYVADVLRGRAPAPTVSRSTPWPGAFDLRGRFLETARHEELLRLASDRATEFVPSTVGMSTAAGNVPVVRPESRASATLTNIGPIAEWFRAIIREHMPTFVTQCDIPGFEPGEIEVKCSAYADGHHFAVHSDNVNHPTRRLSFVYYFHRTPQPYTGGDLLLFDADVSDALRRSPDRFTRIETGDNSLIVFPSGVFHEVTRVHCPSGAFGDARFTIHGHVHERVHARVDERVDERVDAEVDEAATP